MELTQKKILVTGANGMLARDLLPLLVREEALLVLTDLHGGEWRTAPVESLDISVWKQVRDWVGDVEPDWIINCAAYTAVDAAESQSERCFAVNSTGVQNLAEAAERFHARLLHISTDYVFGGTQKESGVKRPFREDDEPAPCGVYGYSKLAGEKHVLEVLPKESLIVRSSWLHGAYGANFLATILRIAKNQKELKIVQDQVGSPTWTGWLAETLVKLMKRNATGVFHATCRGDVSWYDFAEEICRRAGLETAIASQTTEQLGRPAPRPHYSTLDVMKLEQFLGEPCMDWRVGVVEHLRALGALRVE